MSGTDTSRLKNLIGNIEWLKTEYHSLSGELADVMDLIRADKFIDGDIAEKITEHIQGIQAVTRECQDLCADWENPKIHETTLTALADESTQKIRSIENDSAYRNLIEALHRVSFLNASVDELWHAFIDSQAVGKIPEDEKDQALEKLSRLYDAITCEELDKKLNTLSEVYSDLNPKIVTEIMFGKYVINPQEDDEVSTAVPKSEVSESSTAGSEETENSRDNSEASGEGAEKVIADTDSVVPAEALNEEIAIEKDDKASDEGAAENKAENSEETEDASEDTAPEYQYAEEYRIFSEAGALIDSTKYTIKSDNKSGKKGYQFGKAKTDFTDGGIAKKSLRKMIVLKLATEYAISEDSFGKDDDPDMLKEHVNRELSYLFNKGYIKRYTAEGMRTCYVATEKCDAALRDEKFIKFLDMSASKIEIENHLQEEEDPDINGYTYLFSAAISASLRPKAMVVRTQYLRNTIYRIAVPEEAGSAFNIIALASADREDFKVFCQFIETLTAGEIMLCLVGLNQKHVEALQTSMKEAFPSAYECVYFFNLETAEFYTNDLSQKVSAADIAKITGEKIEQARAAGSEADEEKIIEKSAEQTDADTEENSDNGLADIVSENDSDNESAEDSIDQDLEASQSEITVQVAEEIDAVPDADNDNNNNNTTAQPEKSTAPVMDRQRVLDFSRHLLQEGKYYCATTLLKYYESRDPRIKYEYKTLAYAVNDPMEHCRYSTDRLFDIFSSGDYESSEYYLVSAVLRNCFYNQIEYDHSMKALMGVLGSNSVLSEYTKLKDIIYGLIEFKEKAHCGIDKFSGFRAREDQEREMKLRATKQAATEYYEGYVLEKRSPSVSNKRYVATVKLIFGPSTYMGDLLKEVSLGNKDPNTLEIIQNFLCSNFISKELIVAVENISDSRINNFIDQKWDEAANEVAYVIKNTSFIGGSRASLANRIKASVSVLADWYSLNTASIMSNDEGHALYKRKKNDILKMLQESRNHYAELAGNEESDVDKIIGAGILLNTIDELISRLDGSYNEFEHKYFYIDFLHNRYMYLNSDFMPDYGTVDPEIPGRSIEELIRKHLDEAGKDIAERLETNEFGDDVGLANMALCYLQEIGTDASEDAEELIRETETAAEKTAARKMNEFKRYLELAQAYGQIIGASDQRSDVQITDSKKETYLDKIIEWHEHADDTRNYALFGELVDSLSEKVKEDAKTRGEALEKELNVYLSGQRAEDITEDQTAYIQGIKDMLAIQNYTVAEDMLKHLSEGDFTGDSYQIEDDYLTDFQEKFDDLFTRVSDARKTLPSLMLRFSRLNKDTKGGRSLIDNWPTGQDARITPEKTSRLLTSLGFNVDTVSQLNKAGSKDKIYSFDVKLKKPRDGKRTNYAHSIAAFGSKAVMDGFRVAYLFGKYDENSLLDAFRDIGEAKNTIIILDYALSWATRRALARKEKNRASRSAFIVVDRVVCIYLAENYRENIVSRMLMNITLPFAYMQPYIDKSSVPIPPEMFIGRNAELTDIKAKEGANIVYGGRQLGKSALLKMAKGDIDHNENGDRAVYVDIKGLDYHKAAKKVSQALSDEGVFYQEYITENWDDLARAVKNRLRDEKEKIPYLLLLLDEADDFIESSEKENFHSFDALKDIQSTQQFKFVVAGLRNVVRFKNNAALGNNSVLAHLGEMAVKPLSALEAQELLMKPLSVLGIRFPDDSQHFVPTILASTNYFPGLIQMYCSRLIKALTKKDYAGYNEAETPPYYVSEEHIQSLLSEEGFRQEVKDKFMITLKVDGDDYYYLIALLMASLYHEGQNEKGYSAADILNEAAVYDVEKIAGMNADEVAALMEEMKDLNVFRRVSPKRYLFSRRNFFDMLGNKTEIDDEIMKYMGN